jgi:hypothetical protein
VFNNSCAGTLASDHVSSTVRYRMSPAGTYCSALFQLIAAARLVVGEAGADMQEMVEAGRARICKDRRLGSPGADLQVLWEKDEGGQGVEESGINSGGKGRAARLEPGGSRFHPAAEE